MSKELKMTYASPWIVRMQIESEGTFASSIISKEKSDVSTVQQDYHEIDGNAFNENGEFNPQNSGGVTWE